MRVCVLGFSITSEDRSQIHKVLEGCGIDADIDIADIRSVAIDSAVENAHAVIALGKFACNMGRQRATSNNLPFIELPHIKKLYPVDNGGEKKARESAYHALKDLKSVVDSGKLRVVDDKKAVESIKEDQVPDLSPGQIQELKKIIEESGKTDWVCLTKSGQSVRVSLTPDMDNNYDINITFDELMAIQVAMNILQAHEVQFVPPNDKDSESSHK